jgi:rhodanese-related sulfurtransferase
MSRLSLNQWLAVFAFTFALIGLIFSFIDPNGMGEINKKPNYISVISLAEKIRNREPIKVIDLRTTDLYTEFHIPTTKQIPLEELILKVGSTEALFVFYSGDDPLTRHFWASLPDSIQQRSLILYGGIHDWYDKLLYPSLPIKYDPKDSANYKHIEDLSLFYGGQPEFVEEKDIMDYYQQDFSKASWPRSHRQNGLVRKGC